MYETQLNAVGVTFVDSALNQPINKAEFVTCE